MTESLNSHTSVIYTAIHHLMEVNRWLGNNSVSTILFADAKQCFRAYNCPIKKTQQQVHETAAFFNPLDSFQPLAATFRHWPAGRGNQRRGYGLGYGFGFSRRRAGRPLQPTGASFTVWKRKIVVWRICKIDGENIEARFFSPLTRCMKCDETLHLRGISAKLEPNVTASGTSFHSGQRVPPGVPLGSPELAGIKCADVRCQRSSRHLKSLSCMGL